MLLPLLPLLPGACHRFFWGVVLGTFMTYRPQLRLCHLNMLQGRAEQKKSLLPDLSKPQRQEHVQRLSDQSENFQPSLYQNAIFWHVFSIAHMSLVIWLGISTTKWWIQIPDTMWAKVQAIGPIVLALLFGTSDLFVFSLFPLRLGFCQGYVSMIKKSMDFLTHDFLDHFLWQKKGRKKVRCLACIFMFLFRL